jgi:hypothetical protein
MGAQGKTCMGMQGKTAQNGRFRPGQNMYLLVGGRRMDPHLAELPDTQRKLVQLYVHRIMKGRKGAWQHSHQVPRVPSLSISRKSSSCELR